jgi:hypothetical protein
MMKAIFLSKFAVKTRHASCDIRYHVIVAICIKLGPISSSFVAAMKAFQRTATRRNVTRDLVDVASLLHVSLCKPFQCRKDKAKGDQTWSMLVLLTFQRSMMSKM